MINAFLSIIYIIAASIFTHLPNISSTSFVGTAIINTKGALATVSKVLPHFTTALLIVLAFDLTFEFGYFTFKVLYWGLRRLPTQS
jgi:hypothetical protein